MTPEENEAAIDAMPGMREAMAAGRTVRGPADLPRFPDPQPGEPVMACPHRKCKLAHGHDEGVHGRQPSPRTMLGRPIPNRAQRRAKTD